jgi:DDE superfamily endonuclease
VLVHHFNWKRASIAAALCFGSTGGGCQLAFHVQPGSYNTERLIAVLVELRRFLGGQKATLLWDGLPAHRSNLMKAWIASQRDWLVVERLPGYAPELNPTEALWGNLKGKGGELAYLAGDTLEEVIRVEVVVEVFPFLELVVEDLGVVDHGAVQHAVELLGVDAVGALHLAVEPGRSWIDVDVAGALVQHMPVEA